MRDNLCVDPVSAALPRFPPIVTKNIRVFSHTLFFRLHTPCLSFAIFAVLQNPPHIAKDKTQN